jgi:hypothetical protein
MGTVANRPVEMLPSPYAVACQRDRREAGDSRQRSKVEVDVQSVRVLGETGRSWLPNEIVVLIAPVVTKLPCVQIELDVSCPARPTRQHQAVGRTHPLQSAQGALPFRIAKLVSSASYLLTENGLCRKGRPFPKTGSVERGREFHSAHPLLNDSKTAQNRTTVSNDRSGKTPFQGYYNAGQGRIGRGFLRVLGVRRRNVGGFLHRATSHLHLHTRHGIIGISACGVREPCPECKGACWERASWRSDGGSAQ